MALHPDPLVAGTKYSRKRFLEAVTRGGAICVRASAQKRVVRTLPPWELYFVHVQGSRSVIMPPMVVSTNTNGTLMLLDEQLGSKRRALPCPPPRLAPPLPSPPPPLPLGQGDGF